MTSHKLKQPVAHPHLPFNALAGVFGVLALAGLAMVFATLGDANAVQWGVFTSNYIFVMGLTQFGIAFSAVMRVVKARWGSPFTRIGEMATLAFLPLAFIGFGVIYMGGREALLYWITDPNVHSPWLNETLLLWRNLIGLVLFYGVSVIYYRHSLAADGEAEPGPLTDRARVTAGWLLVVFIVNFTFIAWDFGMMSIPHFHSSVYPLHIILGNMNGGTAFLLVLYLLFHPFVPDSKPLTIAKLRWLAILLTGFTLLWLYMFWAQFFVFWFGNLPQETGPLWKQMYGHFGPYFWTMMACVFFIPFVCMISAWFKKHLAPMLTLCLIVIVGVWLNRFLMVLSVVSDDHVALSSAYEIAVVLGWPALHLLILLMWTRLGSSPATAGAAPQNG